MNELRLPKQSQTIDELLCKHPDECSAQSSELVLFNQLVQVDAQKLENQAKMLTMDEGIFEAQEVMIVVLVHLLVQLSPRQSGPGARSLWAIPDQARTPPSYFD